MSIQMNTIDQWVQSTIEQVNQTADKAREHIRDLAHDSAITIKDQYAKFTENEGLFDSRQTLAQKEVGCASFSIEKYVKWTEMRAKAIAEFRGIPCLDFPQ